VFSRIFSRFNKEILVMRPDGTNVRRVTFEDGEDHDATYSPDGTRIAITSERKFIPSPPYGNVHIIRVSDGNDLGDLTEDLAFGAGDPFWSKTERS
jgi:Tol biopolymer transport system component